MKVPADGFRDTQYQSVGTDTGNRGVRQPSWCLSAEWNLSPRGAGKPRLCPAAQIRSRVNAEPDGDRVPVTQFPITPLDPEIMMERPFLNPTKP